MQERAMKAYLHLSRRGVVLAFALIGLGAGCATAKQAARAGEARAKQRIQIVFDNSAATDYFVCKSGRTRDCAFQGPYSMADQFQREGVQRIIVPSDCRGSFHLIQVEEVDSKPEAHVICAQPLE
jgi:hypothetical protein